MSLYTSNVLDWFITEPLNYLSENFTFFHALWVRLTLNTSCSNNNAKVKCFHAQVQRVVS